MKLIMGLISLFYIFILPAAGETGMIAEYSWEDIETLRETGGDRVIKSGPPDGRAVLRVANQDKGEKIIPILTITGPGITTPDYAVTGRIRYRNLEEDGYLEMLSIFPDGSHYFTRTLGKSGPLGKLRGSSGWKKFALPFQNRPGNDPPDKLQVNLVLAGPGTVWIGPLQLKESGGTRSLSGTPDQWWSDRDAEMAGGIGGALLGLIGVLIGALAGRGKARRTVFGLLIALRILGIFLLGAGMIALIFSQPYAVFYPLLLIGLIATVTSWGVGAIIRKRYKELELRRMTAMDTI
ncbi:MAG: hypothetical protein U9N73_06625 [Candidatus Auribacterota bacterium]|nr:hypothetical protein [Candidatus Auribacterota bacterium]